MQLCFALLGQNVWSQVVNVLANNVFKKKQPKKKKRGLFIMFHYHAKLNEAKFKWKEVHSFLIKLSL